jgi:UDP-galactopyranose mutase
LIVGAGLAGLTVAERIANELKESVLVIDKRGHIGGNVYDSYNADGILVQNYGPHIFHTNNEQVFNYLSGFTEWYYFYHRVMTYVDGNLIHMPISAATVNEYFNLNLSNGEAKGFFDSLAQEVADVQTSKDVALSKVGGELYAKFFENYTRKQWGVDPSALDTSVISRVPLRYNRDTRYFTDRYQGNPKHGFTRMCERMTASPRIKILLHTSFAEIKDKITFDTLLYTGFPDEYYDYRFGKLAYRSERFVYETYDTDSYQTAPVINYPNEYDFTRVAEYKKLTGQQHPKTTIAREYPCSDGEPYYTFPTKEHMEVYRQYEALAQQERHVIFLGRLGEYKYYNIDGVVARGLEVFGKIKG